MNKERESTGKLDQAFRMDVGLVKLSIANTLEHETAKFQVAYEIAKRGHKFITEARFKCGSRADVYDLTTDEVYEVETKITPASIVKKKAAYPVEYVWIINPKKDVMSQM